MTVGKWILGIDVSRWNRNVDYEEARRFGIEFTIIRIWVGRKPDDLVEFHFEQAKKVGMKTGAYMALHPTLYIEKQIENSILRYQEFPFDLPLFFDLEIPHPMGFSAYGEVIEAILQITSGMQFDRWGIYSNPGFIRINSFARYPQLRSKPLWLAFWSARIPRAPAPWLDWAIWQFRVARAGAFRWAGGSIDLNRTTPDRLDRLLGSN